MTVERTHRTHTATRTITLNQHCRRFNRLYVQDITSMALQLLGGPRLSFSFVIFFTQMVGLLERVISPSQGRYLHTGQYKHRINVHTDIMPWVVFEATIPAFERAKTIHALRLHGHRDRQRGPTCTTISYKIKPSHVSATSGHHRKALQVLNWSSTTPWRRMGGWTYR
jgi:hypothetical protein